MSLFSKALTYLLLLISIEAAGQETVNLQLRWKHQFQFAGYYMAIEKGFYQTYNIKVNLIENTENTKTPLEKIINREVEFAISGSGIVIAKMQEKPVVALAAISQTSPLVWISLKNKHLNRPHDLINKNLPIISQVESAELLALFKKEGIELSKLNMIKSQFNVDDLINGKVDVLNAYASNEPFLLEQNNIDYTLITPMDYGVNFYSDVLITNQQYAEQHPELVENFTQASLQGWQYAFNHIDETVALIHQKYAPNKSLEHLKFEAKKLKELAMPDLVSIGHMNPGRWQQIANTYQELGMADDDHNIDGLIYQRKTQDLSWLIHLTAVTLFIILILSLLSWRFAYLTSSLRREINRRKFAEQRLKDLNNQLKQQATSDPLTQIYNRRAFFEKGHKLIKLAQRKSLPCCLFMIDLDHFKKINDKYGHHSGDITLKSFVDTLNHNLIREHDIFARIGGEEFVILMLDCDLEGAKQVALRLLDCIRNMPLKSDKQVPFNITASVGISLLENDLDECLNQADAALYQAKKTGRDRYRIAGQTTTD